MQKRNLSPVLVLTLVLAFSFGAAGQGVRKPAETPAEHLARLEKKITAHAKGLEGDAKQLHEARQKSESIAIRISSALELYVEQELAQEGREAFDARLGQKLTLEVLENSELQTDVAKKAQLQKLSEKINGYASLIGLVRATVALAKADKDVASVSNILGALEEDVDGDFNELHEKASLAIKEGLPQIKKGLAALDNSAQEMEVNFMERAYNTKPGAKLDIQCQAICVVGLSRAEGFNKSFEVEIVRQDISSKGEDPSKVVASLSEQCAASLKKEVAAGPLVKRAIAGNLLKGKQAQLPWEDDFKVISKGKTAYPQATLTNSCTLK